VPEPTTSSGIRPSDTTTNGIRVQVATKYLPERSAPKDREYWFAYFIRISNVGSDTAQLISRHWVITNADGEEEEVHGEGVVGEQPVLLSGTSFNYNSFCRLKTPVGTMHGEYTMVTPTGETFEARIAPFTLAVPNSLN
jgi:ApaG protein